MKLLVPLISTLVFTVIFLILAQSGFGLKTAGLYWKPNAWDLTIYSSDTYLIPSRIFWVPLYLLPHKTYEGLGQAIIFTFPYWLVVAALPSILIYLITSRLSKKREIIRQFTPSPPPKAEAPPVVNQPIDIDTLLQKAKNREV